MLGFGKKNKDTEKKEEKDNPKKVESKIDDSDFVVMPEEFRPKAQPKGSSGGGRMIFIIVLVVVLLAGLGATLYVVLFSGQQAQQMTEQPQNQQQNVNQSQQNQITDNQEEEEEVLPRTVSASAFDSSNRLLGSINITIPAVLDEETKDSIGVTVLDQEDLSLPESVQILGGIYSVYPIGINYQEEISLSLSYTNLPENVEIENIKPAYLSGANWREISNFEQESSSIVFSLGSFPAGPLAVIYSVQADDSSVLQPEEVVSSLDSDLDGLTDEEEALLGTDYLLEDTDGDTYGDKAEIFNNYSPLAASETLEESGIFSTYSNTTYGYSVSYPAKWLADSLDQTNKQVLFISDTEEFFEVLIVENPLGTPIVDWYRSLSPSLANVNVDVEIIGGQSAVKSLDGLTSYVSRNNLIYIITYNRGTLEQINWPSIYEFFQRTFKFGNTVNSNESEETENPGSETEAQ